MPKLRLDLCNKCNYNCIFCHNDHMGDNIIEPKLNAQDYGFLTSVAKDCGFNKIVLSGGEPLIRPDINNIINEIAKNNLYIQITTNGYFLDKIKDNNNVKGLNISVHSVDLNTHKEITKRPYMLPKVLNNVYAIENNKNIKIKVNMVAIKNLNTDINKLSQMINYCAEHNLILKIIEIENSNSQYYTPIEKIYDLLISYGFRKLRKYNNNTYLTNDMVNVILQKCFCEYAKTLNNTSHFCNTNNDLYVFPNGHAQPCRWKDDHINLFSAIKNRDSKTLIELITKAKNLIGQNCPYVKQK